MNNGSQTPDLQGFLIPHKAHEIECWWARQESNPQPSRYERPALTVELQAPPVDRRGIRQHQAAWQASARIGTAASN